MARQLNLILAVVLYCVCLISAVPTEEQCDIAAENRTVCGDYGMPKRACELGNCCYDSGFCYKAKDVKSNFLPRYPGKPVGWGPAASSQLVVEGDQSDHTGEETVVSPMINIMTILQMKKDGVSQNIINALLADSIPNGELFYYMSDGKIDASEMMSLQNTPDLDLNAVHALILQGGSVKDMLYSELGKSYGMDPVIMKLLMAGENEVVKEHFMTKINMPADPMSRLVFRSLASGEKLTKKGIMDFVIDGMISSNFDIYTTTAFKAMLSGNKKLAKTFLFLGQMKGKEAKVTYPQNEALFARFVDMQKAHPGKINPTMIFSLAMNEKIPALTPHLTFSELFGVSAFDYVCAVHSPDLQTSCQALAGNPNPSSLDCFNAGCCLRDNPNGGKPVCYENILGNIGVGMASSIWDEKYIVDKIFGGNLPDLSAFYPDGIPWIVSTSLPAFATSHLRQDPGQANWWSSLSAYGAFRHPNPTGQPLIRPDAFNPNFEWTPHGVTPFPYPTQAPDLPMGIPAVTAAPGTFGGALPGAAAAAAPVVSGLALDTFPGCFTVAVEDRIPCMGNDAAWAKGGEQKCYDIGCCYNKEISDPSIPACFSSRDRGQCHNVRAEEKIDCGAPGITSDECLSDPRCCYDSTSVQSIGLKSVPWCYYKKYSFLPDDVRCSKVPHGSRAGCFPKKGKVDVNYVVSEQSCEAAGCCYEKVNGVSFLQRALGLARVPPPCFKKMDAPIRKLDPVPAPAPDPVTVPKCQFRDEMDPSARVDCGAHSWHECVRVKECCYQPELYLQGVPFCFKKSDVPV